MGTRGATGTGAELFAANSDSSSIFEGAQIVGSSPKKRGQAATLLNVMPAAKRNSLLFLSFMLPHSLAFGSQSTFHPFTFRHGERGAEMFAAITV
jgi:hypothetical protein